MAVDPQGQFSSPYLAFGNNPVAMADPDGELAWFFPLLIMAKAAIIGAGIGAAGYTVATALSPGGFQNWDWGRFGTAVGVGALGGAISGGVGIFGSASGIIPNGLLNSGISVTSNGILNAVQAQPFFDNWGTAAIQGFVQGGIAGYQKADLLGKNVWWGNKIKENRNSWSFINTDKPDFYIDMNITNCGSKANNDCVPTTFAEIEARLKGSRKYRSFTENADYTPGTGFKTSGAKYRKIMESTFDNVELLNSKAQLVFDPEYMRQVAAKGEVISFHFGGARSHADNVRKLAVFLNAPMKNKLIFRQRRYNFSQYEGWKNILSIFRIY